MTLRERCRRVCSLARLVARAPGNDRRILLRATWRLGEAWLRLRYPRPLCGYALAAREWTAPPQPAHPAVEPERLESLVEQFRSAQAALPFVVSCLPRSLALARFLRDHGLAPELRLGMQAGPGGRHGHAWVECDGFAAAEAADPAAAFPLLERTAYNHESEGDRA